LGPDFTGVFTAAAPGAGAVFGAGAADALGATFGAGAADALGATFGAGAADALGATFGAGAADALGATFGAGTPLYEHKHNTTQRLHDKLLEVKISMGGTLGLAAPHAKQVSFVLRFVECWHDWQVHCLLSERGAAVVVLPAPPPPLPPTLAEAPGAGAAERRLSSGSGGRETPQLEHKRTVPVRFPPGVSFSGC
jgi:hypothetical protein